VIPGGIFALARPSTVTRVTCARITPMSRVASQPDCPQNEMLTTTEAGLLVGRTNAAIRGALFHGVLAGERQRDRWYVRRGDVEAWAARSRPGRGNPLPKPRTDEVVKILKEYGSASADEVAQFLCLHPGNARKYLALLGQAGQAVRRSDGQWTLFDQVHEEVAQVDGQWALFDQGHEEVPQVAS